MAIFSAVASIFAAGVTSDMRMKDTRRSAAILEAAQNSMIPVDDSMPVLNFDNVTNSLDDLISVPLVAAAAAQSKLNEDYLTEVLKLFRVSPDDESKIEPMQAVMSIAVDDRLVDLQLPLLSFMQPASLAISDVTVDFECKMHNMVKTQSTKNIVDKSNKTSKGGPGILPFFSTTKSKTTSSLTKTATATRDSSQDATGTYTVSVRAKQRENQGMLKLQAMMQLAMEKTFELAMERTKSITTPEDGLPQEDLPDIETL